MTFVSYQLLLELIKNPTVHRMCPNLFLILLIYYYLPFNYAIEPTICLTGVCFKGSWMEEFVAFQGIRYAESPVNKLRFKTPRPFTYSEGVHDVSQESTVRCPQWHRMSNGNRALWGQEDCLLLNIYVPDDVFFNPEDNLELPVMVWIHGGALINGANVYAEYGPKHFMKRNVIVVTINYRLGPLGFLSMGNDVVPGNQGMRDQAMALTWVYNNIVYFGGDKNRITIFGESAGSLSVAFQLISPMSQGLFQRAILQSGTALNPSWGLITPEHAVQFANQAYELLGCDQEQDILSCMQSKEISTIFESLTSLTDIAATVWGPVPDSGFTSEPFLPGDPETLMASGDFHKDIEMIIGTNADEGLLNLISAILEPSLWEDYRKNIDIIGPMSFFNIPDPKEITTKDVENVHRIIEQYVGSISNINEDHIPGITDMYTDASFLYGTFKTLWYARMWEVKVYQYGNVILCSFIS